MKLPSENAYPKQRSKYDFTSENEQILGVPWDLIEMIGLAWEKENPIFIFNESGNQRKERHIIVLKRLSM